MTRRRYVVAVAALAAVAGAAFGTVQHSAAAATVDKYTFSPRPIAAAGTLAPAAAPISVTVTATAAGTPVPSAVVWLSFSTLGLQPPGAIGGSAAVASTALTSTPQSFTANSSGQVIVTYTPAPAASSGHPFPTSGRDVVTAANLASGATVTNTDSYAFSALASFAWSPAAPIAPSGTLAAGDAVTFNAVAQDSTGAAIANATVFLSLTSTASTPGSATAVDTNPPVTRALTTAPKRFIADNNGMVSITYTTPTPLPNGGVDTITAQEKGNNPSITSTDTYTFTSTTPPPPFHPAGVGQPAVTVGSNGTQLIFWSGAGGHLIEAWWNGQWNGPVDWTAANGWAATVNSAPSVALAANGTQLIFWGGPGGHLMEAWWNGQWNGPVDWTAANGWAATVSSAPSVALASDGTTQVIFWQGAGNHLIEAWWNGQWNGPVDWTASLGWPATVTSSPSVAFSGGTQLIFWKGTTGHLLEAWWNGSWNGPVDWTAANNWGSPLTAAPSAVVQSNGTQLIFWPGAGGHLIEAWWNGTWNGAVDWTAANHWGSPLSSAPSAAVQSNGTQLIFWQGGGSHLIEVWWNGSWNGPVDWSA